MGLISNKSQRSRRSSFPILDLERYNVQPTEPLLTDPLQYILRAPGTPVRAENRKHSLPGSGTSTYGVVHSVSDLEERLSAAEAARARLEREFAEHRAAQRGTPEAELAAQVVALQQKNLDLQRSAEKAAAAKKQYKAQVLRMARELAAMHRQQAAGETAHIGWLSLSSSKQRGTCNEAGGLHHVPTRAGHLVRSPSVRQIEVTLKERCGFRLDIRSTQLERRMLWRTNLREPFCR